MLAFCIHENSRLSVFFVGFEASKGSIEYESCDDLLEIIHSYGGDDSNNYKGDIPYPHNVLRNVARKGVATSHVFLIDVDVMPSLQMREQFLSFATKRQIFETSEKLVFVVPVFEKKKESRCPNNKIELIDSSKRNETRPFHDAVSSTYSKKFLKVKNFGNLISLFGNSQITVTKNGRC